MQRSTSSASPGLALVDRGPDLPEGLGHGAQDPGGFHGWLHALSLVDVLQMYHQGAQSLLVRIGGEVSGTIAMQHGEIVHAECGGEVGREALVRLISARSGRLDTSPQVGGERTIDAPFDFVVLDCLRALDEARRGPRAPEVSALLDDWFDESADEPSDTAARDTERELLVAWLAEHAPGAALWRIDLAAPSLERLDAPGAHPETEIGGSIGSIGWAFELAEAADPAWTRVELANGVIAVALVRAGALALALARMATGDAMLQRFHLEAARLASWVARYREGGP